MPSQIDRRAFAAGLLAASVATPAVAQVPRDELIEQRESRYNTIYVTREGGYIGMKFGVNRRLFSESLYNPREPRELPYAYTQYMTAVLAYPAQANSILEIGLGGGRTANYLHLHMQQARITCVELDPVVIELAQRYFGVRPDNRLQLVARDGRLFLRQTPDTYDIIMVDAYRGTFVPFHLLTREFFQIVKRKLKPGGACAQNIESSAMLYDAAIATLRSVFANVDLYNADGNVVAIAYDGPAKTAEQLRARAQAVQSAYNLRYPIPGMLSRRRPATGRVTGRVLTDDFAPVESLRAIERHNEKR
ncbi:MAG: fused MFS/spermidine synthase [Hyphomonadaceae bacterium]|nr:fused MFS/spermidine synthase [Hyphomonadaceae bacterium]